MKHNKYRNRKVHAPEGIFDSEAEWIRWQELYLPCQVMDLACLTQQVKFELVPPQYESYERRSPKTSKRLKDGRRCAERGVYYIADFVYYDEAGMVVEDTKGVRTEAYVIKRKLMLERHGVKIREV